MSTLALRSPTNLYDLCRILLYSDDDTAVGEESNVIKDEILDASNDYLEPISRLSVDTCTKFNLLKDEWENDIAFLSSINEISMHQAYQQIIGMGAKAIPYIIGEMSKKPNHWFWALTAITGENPIPESKRGIIPEMTKAWILWWQSNKHLYD